MSAPSPLNRVLLVEDNCTHQRFAQLVLERAGFAVDVAWNGAEALVALGQRDYAVVLMDCIMPVLTGCQATRRIRSGSGNVRNPNIPIIGISADVVGSNARACLSAGMDDWLSKPVTPQALQEIVTKWLPCVGTPPTAPRQTVQA